MRIPFCGAALAMLVCAGALAAPPCSTLRLGYIDQHRPPFYIGNGVVEATPPGAAVDLVREMASAGGCPLSTVRLPAPRIRMALAAGQIDIAQVDPDDEDKRDFAFPMAGAELDRARALGQFVVVFVRARDHLAPNTEPVRYFKGRTLGVNHGASYIAQLREAGIGVDEGALDAQRNLEKVVLGRIDGFAVTLSAAASMDAFVAQRYGHALVRLPRPLRSSNAWFAVNKAFYEAHRAQVDAMWDWLGAHGRTRYPVLQKRYPADVKAP